MKKTRIQLELEQKKRKKKLAKKNISGEGNIKQCQSELKDKPAKTRIIVTGVCVVSLIAVIAYGINSGSSGSTVEDTTKQLYNIDDKYTIDSDGNVTFLNGNEIMETFPDSYVMTIKASNEAGTSEYTAEIKDGISYYYGTENGEDFNEVQIETAEYSMYLSKTDDTYAETGLLHYAYINGKDIVQSVLCGNNIAIESNKYTSDIIYDNVVNIFPTPKADNEPPKEPEYGEEDVEDYVPESMKAEVYVTGEVIYVSGSGEKSSFSIEIKAIDNLSEDFSVYMHQ